MSNDKSRVTKIIAHVAKKTLLKKFPDYNTIDRLVVTYKGGVLVKEIPKPGSEALELIHQLAYEAGYESYTTEEKVQDQGWISINGTIYSVSEEGDRKSSIYFKTWNKDEEKHYEKVDEIVKELALKDVAVLRGECSITITTRC